MENPATYQIKIQGQLDESWSDWFDDMTVSVEKRDGYLPATTLTGTIADQAALHGILSRIRDLGLPLLLVQHLEDKDSTPR